MNPYQDKVLEFHRAVDAHSPTEITLKDYPFELRCKIILEEAAEFCDACGLDPKAAFDARNDQAARIDCNGEPNQVEMLDALCDLLYVVHGAFAAMGIDPDEYFNEVHRSNMTKLGSDGKPLRRHDGKIMKPENWSPPDLANILRQQLQKQK